MPPLEALTSGVHLEVGRLPVEDGEPPVLGRARDDAKALAEEIAPKIPSLKIVIAGAKPGPIEVKVDEVGIEPDALRQPLKLNPGMESSQEVRELRERLAGSPK